MRLLSTQDYQRAAERLKCPLAAIRAVAEVEAPRGGFDADGNPTTLFEGHHFYRLTRGKFAESHPTLCFPEWTRKHYGKTRAEELDRLHRAQALDWEAACKATSWGKFQIMGFNHYAAGFPDIRSFVTAMCESEGRQLDAFCEFIESQGLQDEMQRADWKPFARVYNGRRFAESRYDTRLDAAYRKWALAAPTA